jgi:putative transposase
MDFISNNLYHFYNRGNNGKKIFFTRENYLFFLEKIKIHVIPYADIICWCLMPNHFHFMIYTKENLKGKELNGSIGIMLRSYTRAINKRYERTGSLFQQKSKTKLIKNYNRKQSDEVYDLICFHYIHQNPLISNLVKKLEDWEFSSFRDYIGTQNGSLVNKLLAYELLNLPNEKNFYKESYGLVSEEKIKNIF